MSHIDSIQRQPASSVAIDRDLSRVEQAAKKNGHKPISTSCDRMETITQQFQENLRVVNSLSNSISSNAKLIYNLKYCQ